MGGEGHPWGLDETERITAGDVLTLYKDVFLFPSDFSGLISFFLFWAQQVSKCPYL